MQFQLARASAHHIRACCQRRIPFPSGTPPGWNAELITSLVFAGIALFLLFLYVSSVMRFILFDSIIITECHIRKGWARHRRHGFEFFAWQLLLALASLTGVALIIGFPLAGAWTLGWFSHPRDHLLPLVLGGVLFLMLLAAVMLTLLLVQVRTKDFVVPQMALENLSAMEGWRRLWAWCKAEKGGYAGYIGMKIVLSIGAGVLLAIISIIVLLVFSIPIAGLGIMAALTGATAGLTWNSLTITLAAVAGFIVFATIMFAVSFIPYRPPCFFPHIPFISWHRGMLRSRRCCGRNRKQRRHRLPCQRSRDHRHLWLLSNVLSVDRPSRCGHYRKL